MNRMIRKSMPPPSLTLSQNQGKMMSGKLLVTIALVGLLGFTLTPLLQAQENDQSREENNSSGNVVYYQPQVEHDFIRGLGLCAGMVSGHGFSYRYFPREGWGWNLGGLYVKSEDFSYFKLGVEPLYILHRDRRTALYLVGGISYLALHSVNEDSYWDWQTDSWVIDKRREGEQGIAVGFGLGYAVGVERIWASLELVLAGYHDSFWPYPQFAVHYFFW